MKKTKHSEGQIAFALKQAETDTAVAEVVRADQCSEFVSRDFDLWCLT